MAQYLISDNVLTDIADAIRGKLGTPSTTYKPVNMKTAINSIPVATTPTLENRTVIPSETIQYIEKTTGVYLQLMSTLLELLKLEQYRLKLKLLLQMELIILAQENIFQMQ